MDGGESFGQAAAAIEFALEGLYLMRRLSKDTMDGDRCLPDLIPLPTGRKEACLGELPIRPVLGRPGPAGAALRRARCARRAGRLGPGRDRPRATRCATCPATACPGRRGLDDLLRRVRERQRELRNRGRLDGTLDQARSLLDTAIGQERAELFPDPSDEARMREAELDTLPSDTAQAIRQLADYDWQSQTARKTFEQLKDLLRREVLDSQFRGMKQALENPDPEAMQRVKDMLGDLNTMLEADARGEHTQDDFDQFMENYGDLFPDQPENLEELVDSLMRRMAAAERLLASLSNEQREELANLMTQALDDAGLAMEMAGCRTCCAARRPDMAPGQARDDDGRGAARSGRRDHGPGRAGRPGRAGAGPAPGLPRGAARRHRRGRRSPGLRPAGRGRRGGAAPDRARARGAGLPAPQRRQAGADPARRCAGWARPRCGGCSPASAPAAVATTTGATPGRPAS